MGGDLMLMSRLIPCLDVRHGRVVKGVNFLNLADAGDPLALARRYCEEGADELVWLDIVATVEELALSLNLLGQARQVLDIPLTVGGGIRSLSHVEQLFAHGADKVSLNTYALENPSILDQIAHRWGSQCLVVAVDAKRDENLFRVYSRGGRQRTEWELGAWLREASAHGAGEFLLTSMDRDGTGLGYDLDMLTYANRHVSAPIIASGGAGTVDHLALALDSGQSSLLLASLVHQGHAISAIKSELSERGFNVRWPVL